MNREVLSHVPVMTWAKPPCVTVDDAALYTGFDRNELQMVFQFEHMDVDASAGGATGKWSDTRFNLVDLKKVLTHWQTGLHGRGWNSLYWNNHDQPRVVSRFGNDSPEFRVLSAKQLATTLHFMQGTPYIYQGEELGMTNVRFESIEDYRDGDSIRFYEDMHVDHQRSAMRMLCAPSTSKVVITPAPPCSGMTQRTVGSRTRESSRG